MTFKMNPGWEDEAKRMAFDAVAPKLQAALDRVYDECSGRPVDEVKPVLQREWTANTGGGTLSDPDLTKYASLISDGDRVVLR
jgi:hypothetical protein